MNNTEWAFLGFIGWFLLILLTMEVLRTGIVLITKRAANDFKPDGSDISPFMHRLARVHANCYESYPFIGGLLLFAIVTNNTETTNGLALWLLGARALQSTLHLLSTSEIIVQARFTCFVAQVIIACTWIVELAGLYWR